MAKFEELNNNLMDVLMQLISSQDLCKLIYYTSEDPLSESDISDTSALLFDKIFPIPKIPDTSTSASNYLTVLFDDIKLSNNTSFKNSVLCFNIICHIDLWRTTGALRPYAIMNKIDNMFNNSRIIGIGKMQFDRSRFTYWNDKYFGYKIDYRIYDFNT